jgi:hypothetical protein
MPGLFRLKPLPVQHFSSQYIIFNITMPRLLLCTHQDTII